MEGTIASILMFGGNFEPANWAFCRGQLLDISQNTALFSLIGTIYGGNGQTNFGLPDLRGRTTLGIGQGPGLSNVELGQVSGTNQVTLTTSNLPSHSHTGSITIASSSNPGTSDEPFSAVPGAGASYTPPANATGNMGGTNATINAAGGSQSVNIQQPYLGTNFIICLYGIYPARN